MKWMTTSHAAVDLRKLGFKVLGEAHGLAHHHYLIEVEDETQLEVLQKKRVDYGLVIDDQAAETYLRTHPKSRNEWREEE